MTDINAGVFYLIAKTGAVGVLILLAGVLCLLIAAVGEGWRCYCRLRLWWLQREIAKMHRETAAEYHRGQR